MFKLTIVTPEKRLLLNQEVEEVTVPAFKGELNILPGHAPLITTLETGVMKWKLKGDAKQFQAVISWGYCQVSPEGVNILSDIADLPEEIDVDGAEAVEKYGMLVLNLPKLDKNRVQKVKVKLSKDST